MSHGSQDPNAQVDTVLLEFEFPADSVWAGSARLVLVKRPSRIAEILQLAGDDGEWSGHPSENAREVAFLVYRAMLAREDAK